ncbi:hypothetical protein GCM10008171_14310 [Methylopila jiangsuensis]|uniref:Uncharacterized protein n=1 Tax=Methylopila jiangsuensis TaxID=586230 RepID=A0A9W6JFP2_9HYPH|nr:NAD(P)H-dependent FMN reductase [Methylopila jiangsuensis]GLK76177.1 hypothetical protein GCM10008171_14310 [Methylopila jiangsuensis]
MLTIPNQSSVAKVLREIDDGGQMKPSPYYEPVVDGMEELTKFTPLTRDVSYYLTDRYSTRRKSVAAPTERVDLKRAD